MKRFTKFFYTALLLLVLPMGLFAQQPYRQYSDDGILLDFHKIDIVDFRAFLLYNLSHDGQFILTPNEEFGLFSITSNDAMSGDQFFEAFDSYYNNTLADFRQYTKDELVDLTSQWKSAVLPSDFLSIMMDIAMRNSRVDNNHCIDSDPFCTSDVIEFEAASSTQTADQLEDDDFNDGCIGSSYNPSWYHMRINTPGQFIIHMEGHDPDNPYIERDVDFCMWGPFDDPISPCVSQLTADKIIDCCYSGYYSEDIYLGYTGSHSHNGASHGTVNYHEPQAGEYYILMITNFSCQPCVISFTKDDDSDDQGPGTTDCGILPGVVSNDGPYCSGETIHLTVNHQAGATYIWSGPNGFSSTQQNPTLSNCTIAMAGSYTCVTTVGGQSTSASTQVVVFDLPNPTFEATTVCLGNPTEFTSTANADDQIITEYAWDFGDGSIDSGENVSHTFAEAGTYEVTHHVRTRPGCENDLTQTVTVVPPPVANFTANAVCLGETTQFTSTSTGDFISGYHWDFGDGQTATGQTASHTFATAGSHNVTLVVEGSNGTCSDNIEHNVTVYAMPVPVATASPVSVQYADASTITVNPGVEGSFSYHWAPEDMVTNPDSQTTQTVPLIETQVYTVTVTNNEGGCTSSTTVTVVMAGSNMTATASAELYELCDGSSTTLHANPIAGTGEYTYDWTPANTLSNAHAKDPVATPELGTTTYSCHVSDGIVDQDVSVSITVYPHKETEIHQTICESTTYPFFGENLSQAGTYHHTLETSHGCDSLITLYLGINDHDESEFTLTDEENCNQYFWDPKEHEIISTDHEGNYYDKAGVYHRTYVNRAGCDSIVTMHATFEYTPDPTEIYPADPNNATPHWVVTATEFQINTYEFIFWDNNPICKWDSIVWTFENPNIEWILEPDEETNPAGKKCTLYVLEQVEDTVWIRATVYNRCSRQGETRRYWFVCSFYDVEETSENMADFSVMPNPNNGTMMLRFDNLSGTIDVKVFDMLGNLIDTFETNDTGTMTYDMSRHADGIYHFVATAKEGTIAKKVIIQH